MLIVYRVKYKPNGFFYENCSENSLTEKGTLYFDKPTLWIFDTSPTISVVYEGQRIETTRHDWEVVAYNLVEIKE